MASHSQSLLFQEVNNRCDNGDISFWNRRTEYTRLRRIFKSFSQNLCSYFFSYLYAKL